MGSDRTRRFARLSRTGTTPATSGDLFAHFGVEAEPPPTPVNALAEPTPALACPDCGWFRATPLVEPCPVCGARPRNETDGGPTP